MPRDLLIELQATHDYLRTIARDLAAFPPDLATLDAARRQREARVAEGRRAQAALEAQAAKLREALAQAQRQEDQARAALKTVSQKAHYAAAIRDVEDRERAKAQVLRLKDLEAKLAALEADLARALPGLEEAAARFEELHAVFLAEHGTQVAARDGLEAKRAQLEAQVPPSLLATFRKLLANRAGKAVAPVEGGACSGCRTKLRTPFLNRLRDSRELTPCESCQRFLYLP